MASHVQVSNRQRKVKLDTKWFTAAAQNLFLAVLENVKIKLPEFLEREQVERLGDSGILSVALVNNKDIQKLNKEWRQKDFPTDVLSFPLDLDGSVPGVPFEMGELIISVEKAAEQAAEYEHTIERELAFLFVHGFLHVLGFDHMTAEDEKDMFGRQKEVLDACGFSR